MGWMARRTPKQTANLRRGGVPATAQAAARAREAKAALDQQDEALEELAISDPMRAMEAVAALTLRSLNRQLRREGRAPGGQPSPAISVRMRETRMLLGELNLYLTRKRSQEDEMGEFLASMAARMETLANSSDAPPIWSAAVPIIQPPGGREE